jgi:hypothetical protein
MATKSRTQGSLGFTIDYKQSLNSFSPAMRARAALEFPYDTPSVQRRENWPKDMVWGSLDHAIHLFLTCLYQKGGIDSETAIKQIGRLSVRYPNLFDPEYFRGLGEDGAAEFIPDLIEILDRFGLGSNANDAARSWVYNMQKLAIYWNGDPRLLFRDVTQEVARRTWESLAFAEENYERLCRRIMRSPSIKHAKLMAQPYGFYGFRHKMVSMFAYFLIDAGIIPRFAYPPPIDFHILRFLCATQVLRFNVLKPGSFIKTPKLLPAAREVTLWYVVNTRTSSEVFAEAMWVLSRELCKRTPGNKCSVDKTRNGHDRVIYEHPVDWEKQSVVRRYNKTCGMCPVESECKWNVDSAHYYVKGGVNLCKAREQAPQFSALGPRAVRIARTTNGHIPISTSLPVLDLSQLKMFE